MENLPSKKINHMNLKVSSSALLNEYKEFYQTFSLTEIIKEPNRIACSISTLLDHILTNCSENVSQKGVIDVGISDHHLIHCTRKVKRIQHNIHNKSRFDLLKSIVLKFLLMHQK